MNDKKILVFSATPNPDLENILTSGNFHFEIAFLPNTLIELAHRQRPQAVLVDVTVLENGLEAIHALREDTKTAFLPIVAIIHKDKAVIETILEAGVDDFVYYPLEALEVQTRLHSVIQGGHARKTNGEIMHITTHSMNGIVDLLTHDFRNPSGITLSSLQLVLEILQDEPDVYPPEIAVLMRHSLFAAQRQAFLLEDMLDVFRLDMNELPIVLEPVSIVPLLEKAAEYIREAGKYNNITIEVRSDAQLPPPLADAVLLGRVINAALDTSLKFCMPGKTIVVEAMEENGGVSIQVIDPGRPVLPPYDQDRFFELEFQNEARTEGSRSSVAMGMPFCYLAIKRMNGEVSIHTDQTSSLTTLRLWLPTH
ncbi:MAG: hybrid sensor histidine kinase/response regulator [Chloroflexi bacterium]|nr:hybrid sensor histidine kinase/response regulator [Chloroflexota bacterium]